MNCQMMSRSITTRRMHSVMDLVFCCQNINDGNLWCFYNLESPSDLEVSG